MSGRDSRCGTVAGYIAHRRDGVDCPPCRNAMRLYEQQRNARRYLARGPLVIDGTGTRRRIQALIAIGYTFARLDQELGRKRSYAHYLANKTGEIHRTSAIAVAEVYERLCMSPAPGWMGDRQRGIAKRNGWVPPLAWDDIDRDEAPSLGGHDDELDEVVVLRLLDGDRVPSTRAEKVEALRRWCATGRSEKSLCDTHGWKYGRYIIREAGAA